MLIMCSVAEACCAKGVAALPIQGALATRAQGHCSELHLTPDADAASAWGRR